MRLHFSRGQKSYGGGASSWGAASFLPRCDTRQPRGSGQRTPFVFEALASYVLGGEIFGFTFSDDKLGIKIRSPWTVALSYERQLRRKLWCSLMSTS